MKPVRYELSMSPEVLATLNTLAAQRGVSRAAVIREALGILVTADRRGPGEYVGITRDREALTTVLMGAR